MNFNVIESILRRVLTRLWRTSKRIFLVYSIPRMKPHGLHNDKYHCTMVLTTRRIYLCTCPVLLQQRLAIVPDIRQAVDRVDVALRVQGVREEDWRFLLRKESK